jgi:hypothetical protein
MKLPKHIERRVNDLLSQAAKHAKTGTDDGLEAIRLCFRRVELYCRVPVKSRNRILDTFCQAATETAI